MVLEAVMLSWSPERSQQSGRSKELSSASLTEEGEVGWRGGCVDEWMVRPPYDAEGWRRECGVGDGEIWMDDDKRDA